VARHNARIRGARPASRRPRISPARLDALIEEAIVDAYGESEQAIGFHATIEQHLALPFEAVVLGVAVIVKKVDVAEGGHIVASHDLEDIIAVVDGRPEIVSEVAAASMDVRRYIASELRTLLDNRDFAEALGGFLLPDAASQGRRSLLDGRLRSLTLP
jgi:hypothetical protein